MTHILKIDSSGRYDGSKTRAASAELVEKLKAQLPEATLSTRDLAPGVPYIHADWIDANFTAEETRNADQRKQLLGSDALVEELEAADLIVISAPIYNFSIPAVLKAWIDQICRANVTFKYGENGPLGLLDGKKAFLVMASGGTDIQGPVDFATNYLRHVLGFIGITDVTVVKAGEPLDHSLIELTHEGEAA